jgi:hypothetical protein
VFLNDVTDYITLDFKRHALRRALLQLARARAEPPGVGPLHLLTVRGIELKDPQRAPGALPSPEVVRKA